MWIVSVQFSQYMQIIIDPWINGVEDKKILSILFFQLDAVQRRHLSNSITKSKSGMFLFNFNLFIANKNVRRIYWDSLERLMDESF